MALQSKHVFMALTLALASGSAVAAPKKKVSHHPKKTTPKKAAPVAPKWVTEELTIASDKSKGCFMRYQRRHDPSGYDVKVGFAMSCCDYSKEGKCCPQNPGENGFGFDQGCKPLLRTSPGQTLDNAWLTPEQMAKVGKRSCEVANQCQVGGVGLSFGAGLWLLGAYASAATANWMGTVACVGTTGVTGYAAYKAMTSRPEELRECAKVTDIKFKPNDYVKLKKTSIFDATTLLRTTMKKALVEETRDANVVEQGAHNVEIMASPERQGAEEFIDNQKKTTGNIIPNPNQ